MNDAILVVLGSLVVPTIACVGTVVIVFGPTWYKMCVCKFIVPGILALAAIVWFCVAILPKLYAGYKIRGIKKRSVEWLKTQKKKVASHIPYRDQ